jgi:hypothetical protein
MEYNVDYFIGKFSAIPEGRWTTGDFKKGNRFCANGHCGITADNYLNPNEEAKALAELFKLTSIKRKVSEYDSDIFNYTVVINDGLVFEYNQNHPKQRILAALQDVKKLQEVEKNPKERIVYVTVDEPVRKLQKEVELN